MKKLIALLLALVMVLGLVACGQKAPAADAPAADAPAADAPVADAPANEEISGDISFIHYRTDLEPQIKALIEGFMEEYPNVNVEIEVVTDYYNNMATRISANEIPDVFWLDSKVLFPEQWPEYLLCLDGNAVTPRDRLKDIWSFEDHVYAISTACSYTGFFYNKALWAEAGIEKTPTTWAEFEDAMTKLSQLDGVIPLTTQYKTAWAISYWLANYGGAYCGDPTGNFYNYMAETDEPFSNENVVAILNQARSLVDKGLVDPDLMSSDWDMQAPDFAAGTIGTYLTGSFMVATMIAQGMDPSEIGAFAYPAPDGSGVMTTQLSRDYGFCTSKTAEYPEACVALCEYLALNYAPATGQLSAIEGVDSGIAAIEEMLATDPVILARPDNNAKYTEINAIAAINLGTFVQEYLITDDTQGLIDQYNATWAAARAECGY